ncbi:DciA family protein [Thalassobaculum sp.]|uniref:DUF721 domain-containing protein n=1 Tax=Thalassobaculum sp. TaxID=2022740 RepID=UPI0032EC2C25
MTEDSSGAPRSKPTLKPASGTRRAGLRALAGVTPGLTDPLLRKRGFVEGRIVHDWPLIVGTDLAASCLPESLAFPRGKRDGATLRLLAAPARALELQHALPQLIERVNAHFGWAAVARVAIRQGPLPAKPKPRLRPMRPLSLAERAGVAERVAAVSDPELRRRLAALGEAVRGAKPAEK